MEISTNCAATQHVWPSGPVARVRLRRRWGRPALNRGAAFGDFDNDGRIDIVVSRLGREASAAAQCPARRKSLAGSEADGRSSNRDAIGAVVHVRTAPGEQWNHVTTSVGYASSSDVRVHFGIGRRDAGHDRSPLAQRQGVALEQRHTRTAI